VQAHRLARHPDGLASRERIGRPVETQHGEAARAGARAARAENPPARRHLAARRRRRTFQVNKRHDAGTGRAAVLHARDDLLADVAALVEVDSVQLIHEGFVRKGVAEAKILRPFRHAKSDAMSVVDGRVDVRPQFAEGHDGAPSEFGKAWIVGSKRKLVRPAAPAPADDNGPRVGEVGDGGLGAQLVKAEAPGEIGRLRLRAIEEVAALRILEEDEIEEDFAMRAEEAAIARLTGRETVEIAGQQPVEKGFGVLARDRDNAAVGEMGDGHQALRAQPRA
jgi:hypothetical protein